MADSTETSKHRRAESIGEDDVLETDPEERYYCYRELVGRGKFKSCHKAFDSQIGIDVAWSKIAGENCSLSDDELHGVISDIQRGLDLDHPNIIKCFKCWEDPDRHCINLITELFTSGNLRQYRNLHKHLDMKAVKRMGRQILRGLQYLHSMEPPITHGDLRCDKIYVNGHSGEIKIGDLGLATLMPYRWDGSGPPPQQLPMDASSDIFAFGLCILELLTLKQLDPQHCAEWPVVVAEIQDEDARAFITKCLDPSRPDAEELLEDSFLCAKKTVPGEGGQGGNDLMMGPSLGASSKNLQDAIDAVKSDRKSADDIEEASDSVAVGRLRGEDYEFEFAGKVKEGKMHFRLLMTQAISDATESLNGFSRTIDFVFDPEDDTVDKLASEISETFNLSPTDTEICAAALREWLAKEMPALVTDKQDI